MNTVKLFFSFVLLFAGLLVLPFAVIGNMATGLIAPALVFLLGGSPIYIIYLLWQDDFQGMSRHAQDKIKQVALLCSFLGIGGQIALRLGYGYSGTALYSEFLLGSTEATPLALILFFLTALASAASVLPIYLWAIASVDFSYHDYVIITQTVKGEEVGREYGSSSMERPYLAVTALITALFGLLSSHVLLLFVILGINLWLFMPTARAGKCMLWLSVAAGVILFLATLGNVGYSDSEIVLALDIWPILLFGLAALALWLGYEGHVYTLGMCAIFFGAAIPTWILAFIPSMLMKEAFPIPFSGIGRYIVLGFFAVALILGFLALRSVCAVVKMTNRHDKSTAFRWVVLIVLVVLLSVILLSAVLGVSLLPDFSELSLAGLFSGSKPVEVEYTLYQGATFTQGGVCYGISNKGVIALYVADKAAKSITLSGWDGQMPDSMTDKAEELLYADKAKYTGKVYAVAEGFLYGNHTIETLTTAGEITYFADGCIKSSPNLAEINLCHTVPAALEGGRACNKEAFEVSKGCRFVVGNIGEVVGYATTLGAYDGRLEYADDVYYRVTLGVGANAPADPLFGEYFVRSSGSFQTSARVMGVRSVSLSGSFSNADSRYDKLGCSEEVKVFEKGDTVRYNARRATAKTSLSGSGSIVLKAWVLENADSFGGSGTVEHGMLEGASVDFGKGSGGVSCSLYYGAD